MDGEIRRREIVKRLRETEKPISATRFAKAFDVSRQIIVGDVALLRATGVEIVATARGYMLEQPLEGIERKIACQHTPEQTREELSVIVAKGGEVVDVSIAHPLYGELIGSLRIQSEKDIDGQVSKRACYITISFNRRRPSAYYSLCRRRNFPRNQRGTSKKKYFV